MSRGEDYRENLGPGTYDYDISVIKPRLSFTPIINPEHVPLKTAL